LFEWGSGGKFLSQKFEKNCPVLSHFVPKKCEFFNFSIIWLSSIYKVFTANVTDLKVAPKNFVNYFNINVLTKNVR